MARERPYISAMNGGAVSALGLARLDLARMKVSCEQMDNILPRVIGPMLFRPGLGYKTSTKSNSAAKAIPFIYSASDTANIEVTDGAIRILIDGVAVTRSAVSTTVTNGDFSSSSGWTLTTTGGGVSSVSGGELTLRTFNKGSTALCKRSVSVSGGDQGTEHALEITVSQGPVQFRCGSTDGGQEYIREIDLDTGFHSVAFTPTGTFYVQFSAESVSSIRVDEIAVASSGDLEISAPWAEADLSSLRYDQSGDVIYVTSSTGSYQPRRILRTLGEDSPVSWSLTKYEFTDGPFLGKTANVKLSPSARNETGTLTSSAPFFDSGQIGAVFRLTHTSTEIVNEIVGEDQYSDYVEISGGGGSYYGSSTSTNERLLEIEVVDGSQGVWATGGARLAIQISYDDGETWATAEYINSNSATFPRYPGSNGSVVLVRVGFPAGEYVQGGARVILNYEGGGRDGFVRITGVTNSTTATYDVLDKLYQNDGTENWVESKYSDLRGWPTAVGFLDGRLWWGDRNSANGSVSDDFSSFDLDVEGNSGPILRSIATGPVNRVLWILGLQKLIIGTSGAEVIGKSSSFDEPVTPTNFSLKDASTQGSADVQAVKIDNKGAFAQRSGKKLFDAAFAADKQDYVTSDLTRYHPTILEAGVKSLAVQRQPDTRIWIVLNDGTAACLLYEPAEDVISWFTVSTDGEIEDISVLPSTVDDDVHMIVKRTIGGVTKRFWEVMAYESQAQGGTDNRIADSHVVVTVTASATVTGLSHLEGEDVVVWAAGEAVMDGDDPKTFTVSGGEITLDSEVTGDVIVGLSYTGLYKGPKLGYGVPDGSALSRKKTIRELAALLYKTHHRGILFGQDFTTMDPLPLNIDMEELSGNTLLEEYDQQGLPVPGQWDTDARLHMKMRAPLPATVMATSMTVEGH